MRAEINLQDVYTCLVAQRSRAMMRMQGLLFFGKLGTSLSLEQPALLPELTHHLALALRRNAYSDLPQGTKAVDSETKKVRLARVQY